MSQALLRQELESRFNKEELRTLSFDMGIDYENFPETKEGMARELISYCERRERLPELVERLQELRPEAAWDEIWHSNGASGQMEVAEELTWPQLLDYARRQHGRFLQASQGTPDHPGIFVPELYVPRSQVEEDLRAFLDSDAAALIVLGEPGVGKTNLLCQWAMALLTANQAAFYYECGGSIQGDIEAVIARDLGLNTPNLPAEFLDQVSRAAGQTGQEIILIFDAINEFRQGNQVGTAVLLKQIDALVGRLPEQNVRIIFSCRTVPWRQLENIDATQLFWHRYFRPANAEKPLLLLNQFDDALFAQAYEKYQTYFQLQTERRELPDTLRDRLKRPLLLRMMAETYRDRSVPTAQESLALNIYRRFYEERVKTRRDQAFIDGLVMLMFEYQCSVLSLDMLEQQPQLRDEVLDETPESSYQRMLAAGVLVETPGDLYRSAQVHFMYDAVGSYALARRLLRQSGQDGELLSRLLGEKREFHLAWETAVIVLLLDPKTAVFTDLAQSPDVELRELAVAGLVEYHANKPAEATAIITDLLQTNATEAHRTGLKAAYLIGQEAQDIFLAAATSRSRELRQVAKIALYLLWRRDPDFVNDLFYSLMDRIELAALRQTRYVLEFIIDLSVTIYINHCDEPGLAQQISDLYYELIKNRLHLDWLASGILGPAVEKLVAKAVGSALAKPVMDTFQYTEIVTRDQLSGLSAADKRRYQAVLNLVDPATDLRPALADIAAMLESPAPFVNVLAAMPLAAHAVADFAGTEPILQQLFDEVGGYGRFWILLSLAVQIKQTPPAWIGLLETFTRRFITENADSYTGERSGFFAQFDAVLIPLGLAYGKRGVDMPYFEALIEDGLANEQWPQLQRTLTALGPVGFFYPQAVFHTLIAAVDDFNRPELQDALVAMLSVIRVLHLDEVDVFLRLIGADETLQRQVAAATDILGVEGYIYRLGVYNNAIYDALNHPKMRRSYLIGSLSVLIEKQSPKDFLAYYAETGMRMSRDANYRLIEWTLPD